MGTVFGWMNAVGAVFAIALTVGFVPSRAAGADDGGVESRMFELTYANAKDIAENFNRTWCVQVKTNGSCGVGEMAVAFAETMRDE